MRYTRHQRGFALISAVLLITGILAVATVSALLLTGRSVTTAQGLEALRAHYAARSGVETGIAQALAAGCGAVPASVTVEGFSVSLACESWDVNEAGADYPVYRITASAARGTIESGTLVSRTIRISLVDQP
jgi:MSHA biogenesis protein MshP